MSQIFPEAGGRLTDWIVAHRGDVDTIIMISRDDDSKELEGHGDDGRPSDDSCFILVIAY